MSAPKFSLSFSEHDLDAIFSAVVSDQSPGVAAAVGIGGVPVYGKGFGLANMELPTQLSSSMRMRIGSITKHFTCLLYLLLCEDGEASLDDEVGGFVNGLHDVTKRATIRQLMSHTSGIRDVLTTSMVLHGTGQRITDDQMLAYYATIDSVDFEAQTSWSYNNGGYVLLTAAIERITGEKLENLFRTRIFEPIGMNDTMLRRWDTDFVPNSATLHMVDRQGRFTRDYMGMELTGVGGLVSTMDDMLRWVMHMDAPVVGSKETWRSMKEPQNLLNGRSTGYGLGLISGVYRGIGVLSHGGTLLGGHAQMIKLPAAGLDICIASNRADVSATLLASKVIDVCVNALEAAVEARGATVKGGAFRSTASGAIAEVKVRDNQAFLSINGGGALPVSPDSEGVLRLPPEAGFLKTSLQVGEKSARLMQFGNEDLMDELDVQESASLGNCAGRYHSAEFDVALDIAEDAGGTYCRSVGRHGAAHFKLYPITTKIWRAETCEVLAMANAVLTFAEDGHSLVLSSGRLAALHFERIADFNLSHPRTSRTPM